MSAPLLSAAQLAAMQQFALTGMQTPITIQRRTTTDSDYGDRDAVSWVTVATTKGWFHSTPTPVQQVDSGSTVTVNTYRLFVPVGTNVREGDHAIVGSDTYTVSDTTRETTWQAMLVCSLRKRD